MPPGMQASIIGACPKPVKLGGLRGRKGIRSNMGVGGAPLVSVWVASIGGVNRRWGNPA